MADREAELLDQAIIDTEKEIAGSAWGDEEPVLDETGDRSVEGMGDGLEGQHEEDEDGEGEAAEGAEFDEGEGDEADKPDGEADKDGKPDKAAPDKAEKPEGDKPDAKAAEREGRVPPGRLREASERARAAEAERDKLKGEIETERGNTRKEIDTLRGQLDGVLKVLQQQGKPPAEKTAGDKPAADEVPDLFENPKGFLDHVEKLVQRAVQPLSQSQQTQRLETSFAIAHAVHKEAFEKAFAAVNQLDRNSPDDRATVTRIWNSPNPGEALVAWHKRAETLREVGDDPAAYRQRVIDDLKKDPEFRKSLLADLRTEAQTGDNGRPRTEVRLPPSLNRAAGSNLRAEQDADLGDGSDQAIADAAWR